MCGFIGIGVRHCGLAPVHFWSLRKRSSPLPLSHTVGVTSTFGWHFGLILCKLSGSSDVFFLPLNLFHFSSQPPSLSYSSYPRFYSSLSLRSGYPPLFLFSFSPPDPSFRGGSLFSTLLLLTSVPTAD